MRAFLFGLSPSSSSYVFLKGYFAVTYSVALAPLPSPRARVCACVRVPFGWPSKLGISSVLGGTTPGALSPMVSRKSLLAPLTTAPSLVRPRAVCICSLWWVAFEAGL